MDDRWCLRSDLINHWHPVDLTHMYVYIDGYDGALLPVSRERLPARYPCSMTYVIVVNYVSVVRGRGRGRGRNRAFSRRQRLP